MYIFWTQWDFGDIAAICMATAPVVSLHPLGPMKNALLKKTPARLGCVFFERAEPRVGKGEDEETLKFSPETFHMKVSLEVWGDFGEIMLLWSGSIIELYLIITSYHII